jgi:RNA polymerase sigma-70 factor (ECF subfamily)
MTLDLDYYWLKVKNDGDEKAFECIFNNTFQSLCFYAFQISANRFLAEEIVQEVFIKLWQNRDTIQIKENFKSYLYQMVHNQAITKVVQQQTQKNATNATVSNDVWQIVLESSHYNAYLVEKLEAEDTQKIINETIDQLPPQGREVFTLSKFNNQTNEEIASSLNISVNTVRTHIYRALEKIKDALGKIK